MSQVTVTTTTSHVTVVCSSASTTTMTVIVAPTSMGLPVASGQHDVNLLPPLIPRDTINGIAGLTTVLQQQLWSQIPSQDYASYSVGASQVTFFFRTEPPTDILCWCLLWCLVFAFRFQYCCHVHQFELNNWGMHHATLHSIPMTGTCASWCWHMGHPKNEPSDCSLHCFSWGSLMLLSCPPAIQSLWWGSQL